MANRIEPFVVEVPALTTISAFQRTDLPFLDGRVTRLEITIPPGPSGLMGFRIAHSGQSVIPPLRDEWTIADNQRFDWDMELYPTGAAWECWAYNLGEFSHSIYMWFHVSDIDVSTAQGQAPLSIAPGTSRVTETEVIFVGD